MELDNLTAIAEKYKTDKAGLHAYTNLYDEIFGPMRQSPLKLLEIGVGGNEDLAVGGHSLRMWKEYFPQGLIVGLDLHDKTVFAEDRIEIITGDQSDPSVLNRITSKYGLFDIIIDDGSHISEHVIASFRHLFPHYLKPGGFYVVEDLQTSYWPSWGGSLFRRSRRSSMAFLKERADGLNYREYRFPKYVPSEFDRWINEIRFQHNIVVVRKREERDNEDYQPLGWKRVLRTGVPEQLKQLKRLQVSSILRRR